MLFKENRKDSSQRRLHILAKKLSKENVPRCLVRIGRPQIAIMTRKQVTLYVLSQDLTPYHHYRNYNGK